MALCIKRKNSREGALIKMRKKSKQKRDGLNKSGETQKVETRWREKKKEYGNLVVEETDKNCSDKR